MKIPSLLRGGLPSILERRGPPFPHHLGEGVATNGQGEGTTVVFGLQWMLSLQSSGAGPQEWVEEADVLLWRPAPSTVFLGGWSTTTVPIYAGTTEAGLPPVGVAWTVRSLPSLSSCSAWKRTELTWMWSIPSREMAHEDVF
jgi:hypothetical protein